MKKVEDEEIDVFRAERYFKGKVEVEGPQNAKKDETSCQTKKEEEQVDMCLEASSIPPGTPSVRSESSWNSRIALLFQIPRNQPRKKSDDHRSKSFFANLGCSCSCNDKQSLDVDEQIETNISRSGSNREDHGRPTIKEPAKESNLNQIGKSHSSSWVRNEMHSKKFIDLGLGLSTEDRFSFPILKSDLGNLAAKIQSQEDDFDPTRKSLEVFGSPVAEKGTKNSRMSRRLDVLSWDAIPHSTITPNGMCNDAESDASSDLFEIESFTNTANSFITRQASEGMSTCVTPTTCYAPSEASIEWSVVTASVADSSLLSDMEDPANRTNSHKPVPCFKSRAGKDVQKSRTNILSGCRSHKAVRVAGDAYKTNQKIILDSRGHPKFNSFSTAVSSSQAENKLAPFDPGRRQQISDTPLQLKSHSSNDSHALYIH